MASDDMMMCKSCNLPTEMTSNMTAVSNAFNPLTCLVNTGKGIGDNVITYFYAVRLFGIVVVNVCSQSLVSCIPAFIFLIIVTLVLTVGLPFTILQALFSCGNFETIFNTSIEVDNLNCLLRGLLNDESFVDKINEIDNSHRMTMTRSNENEAIQNRLESVIIQNFGHDGIGAFLSSEIKQSLVRTSDAVDEASSDGSGTCVC
jgi:hypothetical protein